MRIIHELTLELAPPEDVPFAPIGDRSSHKEKSDEKLLLERVVELLEVLTMQVASNEGRMVSQNEQWRQDEQGQQVDTKDV